MMTSQQITRHNQDSRHGSEGPPGENLNQLLKTLRTKMTSVRADYVTNSYVIIDYKCLKIVQRSRVFGLYWIIFRFIKFFLNLLTELFRIIILGLKSLLSIFYLLMTSMKQNIYMTKFVVFIKIRF